MSPGATTIDDDDDVYPTGRIDNGLSIKPMVLSLTLRFNDVLSATQLHTSLCTLLATGDWRRLAGRLRKPSSSPSTLTLHAPRVFTAARPAVAFSHADLSSTAIAAHPLGKDLPATNGASAALHHPGEHFRAFAAAEDYPDTVEGFLGEQDRPVLSLRVTSFRDATLVALAAPHLLVDAMALGELLRAWSLVLAGREDDVPPVLAAREDVLYDAADPARKPAEEEEEEEPWALRDVYLTGFAFVLFVVRFLWGLITERTIESRVIFLPGRIATEMRQAALADISEHAQEHPPPAAAWVSEGDVLFAWACRVASLGQGARARPLNAHNALNLRRRLPETTPPPASRGVYVRNLITLSYVPVSAAEARGPLGLVAAKYRAALTAQSRPAQARHALRAARAAVDAGQDGNIVCGAPPTGELLSMTNWLKADVLGAADFAPAVVGAAEGREGHVPGRIVYVHSQLHARSALVRNTLGVVGKDQHGGIWMQGFFPPRTWAALERELDELNEKWGK